MFNKNIMHERAMFIGNDRQYIHGCIYKVTIEIIGCRMFVNNIPYDTLCAVNKNWRFIGI